MEIISHFRGIICAWADKGHLYITVKTIETTAGYVFMKSYVIIIPLCSSGIFCDTQVEVFFSRGQNKCIHEALALAVIIIKCTKWDVSMCKRSVDM